MAKKLTGKRVAALATNGFEQSELLVPKKALEKEGAIVDIISIEGGKIRGWSGDDWGKKVTVDFTLSEVKTDEYNALLLPGGQINPDLLRADINAIRFIRSFVDSGKPVAAICHAPWLLIEADVVEGKEMTSFKSIRTDLQNAGAIVKDEETVQDGNLLTSRNPGDLKAFSKELIKMVDYGIYVSSRKADSEA